MGLNSICIREGGNYRLFSVGNGWGYRLEADGCDSLWWQDDDATVFKQCLDAYETAAPWKNTNEILAEIYRDYK